jgi:hypothetical protein
MANYKYLLDKNIFWTSTIDANRGLYKEFSGKVLSVKGKNILVNVLGSVDWYWIPFMQDIKIIEE